MIVTGFGQFGNRVEVTETLPRICFRDVCEGQAAGTSVGSYLGATIDLERFLLRRSDLTGVQLARGGEADLRHGVVRDHAIGANVQTEGFDLGRLMDDVRFEDNGRNLDAAMLPIPELMLGP